MDIVAKINDDNSFGGNFYTKDVKEDWNTTVVIYDAQYLKPIWNNINWIEGATQQEIEEHNKSLVPKTISRMKFKMQIRRSTIYTYEIIIAYIQNIVISENFTEEMKQDILDRLEDCTHFERYSPDFIMLANMMNVSDEIKDEIFINGNLIE